MERFKIFFGTHSLTENHASRKLNKWLDDNPNIRIMDWQYQQARMGDHSICVTYFYEDGCTDNPDLEPNERERED